MSVWHRPDASTFTSTCPGPGLGVGRSSMRNGWVKSWTTAARILVPPVRAVGPNVARRAATWTESKVPLLTLDEDGDDTRMMVTSAHDHPELVLVLDIVWAHHAPALRGPGQPSCPATPASGSTRRGGVTGGANRTHEPFASGDRDGDNGHPARPTCRSCANTTTVSSDSPLGRDDVDRHANNHHGPEDGDRQERPAPPPQIECLAPIPWLGPPRSTNGTTISASIPLSPTIIPAVVMNVGLMTSASSRPSPF